MERLFILSIGGFHYMPVEGKMHHLKYARTPEGCTQVFYRKDEDIFRLTSIARGINKKVVRIFYNNNMLNGG